MKIPVFQGPGQPRPRTTPVAQAGNGDGLQSVQVQDLWAQGAGLIQARAGLDYLRTLRA